MLRITGALIALLLTACAPLAILTGWTPGPQAVTVTGTYDTPSGVLTVYSDTTARFDPYAVETFADCAAIDWTELDGDGQPFIPVDVNADGFIDCASDVELGA